MRYFTSDNHFNHKRIIELCNRPFVSMEEMNSEMIRRWNAVVTKDDEVFHLGDLMFYHSKSEAEALLAELNGKKHLIGGNHDPKKTRNAHGWCHVSEWQGVMADYWDTMIYMIHDPSRIMDFATPEQGAVVLHGHHHGDQKSHGWQGGIPGVRYFDVGVDGEGASFAPWSELEIARKLGYQV